MEKIFRVKSSYEKDGLMEINQYLSKGWKVKMIAPNASDDYNYMAAYIVLEKPDTD